MARKSSVINVIITGDAKGLNKTLDKAGGKLKTLGKVAGAAGLAIAGATAFSIKKFADFDQAMTKSTAIMGDVSDAMRDDMASAAREVAKTTTFSAEQAAESYFFLASAGLDAAASIEALPQVAAFAQAGAFDMATATDLLTDAQSALGLAVDDTSQNIENLGRASDVLVKANTLANASVQQFSEALTNKAGASMRSLNMEMEEGVAVLGVFADQGLKGSEAGTTFNAVIRGLTEGVQRNAEAWEEHGISVFDSSGEMNNMADIVEDMESALDGMSVEQQRAVLSQLGFTEETLRGTQALLGNSDAIRDYEEDLQSAGGTTQQVADKQLETFWAKLGIIKDQLIDVALSIGESLMPAVEAFADWLSDNLPAITSWFERVSAKFTDLLGVSEESMGGAIQVASDFGSNWQRVGGDTTRAINDMESETGTTIQDMSDGVQLAMRDMERETGKSIEGAASTVDAETQKMGEDFDEAGSFMDRMWQAWLVVWDQDIKPWFMGTVVPWVENTLAPAIGDAFLVAGEKAADKFLEGLSSLAGRIPSFLADKLSGFSDIADMAPGGMIGNAINRSSGGSQQDVLRDRDLERELAGFDDGGIIPGRKGEARIVKAHGGETILPTHKETSRPAPQPAGPMTVILELDRQEIARALIGPLSEEAGRVSRHTAGVGPW